MQVEIERASIQNLDVLHEIEKKCFQDGQMNKQQIAYWINASNGVCLVSRVKHEIAGFIIGRIHIEKESISSHILTVDVLPRYHCKGIGLKLLEEIEEIFRNKGVKKCQLEVQEDNIPALKLYKKVGYKEAKILENYYGATNGIRFKKHLT